MFSNPMHRVTDQTQFMPDRTDPGPLDQVVMTADQFDEVVSRALPALLDRAAVCTKRFLRETGQWIDDMAHEKFVLRWGAEYLEKFLVCGRNEVPCRPLFLLDSLVAKEHSQPEPFLYHPDLLTPLGRLIDGLLARATISRDALMALYHHCYGLGPGQIIAIVGLNGSESQRIYKNFQRWRDTGWQRTIEDLGITPGEIQQFEQQETRQRFSSDAERMLRCAQRHYRKSEPEHYACLSRSEWEDMFVQGCGTDYRIWHFALCVDCLTIGSDMGGAQASDQRRPRVQFHVRP